MSYNAYILDININQNVSYNDTFDQNIDLY